VACTAMTLFDYDCDDDELAESHSDVAPAADSLMTLLQHVPSTAVQQNSSTLYKYNANRCQSHLLR